MPSSYLCWEMLEDERERNVLQGRKGLFMLALLIHDGERADLAKLNAHQLVLIVNRAWEKDVCHLWEDREP